MVYHLGFRLFVFMFSGLMIYGFKFYCLSFRVLYFLEFMVLAGRVFILRFVV